MLLERPCGVLPVHRMSLGLETGPGFSWTAHSLLGVGSMSTQTDHFPFPLRTTGQHNWMAAACISKLLTAVLASLCLP